MPVNPLRVTDYFGNGRIEPSVFSIVHVDTRVQQRLQAFRDVAILSWFEGGPSDSIPIFTDPEEMHAILDPESLNGQGIQLADYARVPTFDPRIPGAYRMYGVRVGIPTKSTLTLNDATSPTPLAVITLNSVDLGTYVNKLSVEILTATVQGKRVILRYGSTEQLSLDNLRNAINVKYIGNASAATMTITRSGDIATRLQTTLTGATDGSTSLDLDLTAEEWNTVVELAQYINAQPGYSASMNVYADALLPTSELDAIVATNIRQPIAFTIQYTGAGSAATLTITDSLLTTDVTGAVPDNLSLSLTAPGNATLGLLVSAIQATGDYTVTLGPNADLDLVTSAALANITAVNIFTAPVPVLPKPGLYSHVLTAALGSVVHAINTRNARLVATRLPSQVTPPANLAKTFMAGGTNPVPTVNDWIAALNLLKDQDLLGGMVLPNTSSSTLHDIILAWVVEQRKLYGATYRAFFGAPPAQSQTTYRSLASALNSPYATLAVQRVLSPNGVTQQDPLYVAAMMCGLASGVPIAQTTTNVAIRCRDLLDRYSLANREEMEGNGISMLKEVKGRGIVTAFSLTTSLSAARMHRVLSESMAIDYIDQNVRLVLYDFLGAWGTRDLIPQVKGRVEDVLKQLLEQGIITTGIDQNGKILRAYTPPQVGLKAGVLTVVWRAFIGGEVSQIAVQGFVQYQVFEIQIPVGQ